MRTILTAWFLALALYMVTPYAMAETSNPQNLRAVWTGYHVVGDVCINVKDKRTGASRRAEMWLVNNGEVALHAMANGITCFEVMLGARNELLVNAPENEVDVYVVRDDTTPFFTVELPM